MMKKILCLAMTVLMVLGAPMTVFGAELGTTIPEPSWTVTFTGSQMKSNATGSELQEKFSGMEPGDFIHISVELLNESSGKTNWYMENSIIQAMEDNNKASGGAYTYILTYIDPDNKATEIYNSKTVGGETASNGAQGLREIEGIESPFFLDRLEKSEKAYVTLYVKLDGETITNSYQKNLTVLGLNFAVEKIKEGTVTREVTQIKQETVTTVVPTMVQTGDDAPVVLFSTLTLACGLALVVMAVKSMAKKRGEKGKL